MRKWGLEWLWRIKEEPQLWRRYWNDGIVLLQLLLTHVVPLLLLVSVAPAQIGRQSTRPADRTDRKSQIRHIKH